MISPKYDECMKELFRNETVRKYFLSDVLAIPVQRIQSVRLLNTHLWRRYRKQKSGILDVLMEFEDGTKINIELQINYFAHWDRRQIFYLSKLYTEDFWSGEQYSKLSRCIGISILDFNLTDREEYHSVYRLRDEKGHEFSDVLEIHIIELRKQLHGDEPMNDWIRFFNAKTEEDLNMIKTKNTGIHEARRIIREMSLNYRMRMRYEAHLKEKRDRWAREDYVRSEGIKEGIQEGIQQGEDRLNQLNLRLISEKRYDDMERAAKDEEYRNKLYKKYDIL